MSGRTKPELWEQSKKEEIVDYSKNYCFNCHKNKGEDKFNIKCESCNIIICDDCIEGDLLNGVKCIHCSRFLLNKEEKRQERISRLKHQICIMMDEITYAQKMVKELENGGYISDSDSEDEHFYLDNINGV
jgi:hypothetical protein